MQKNNWSQLFPLHKGQQVRFLTCRPTTHNCLIYTIYFRHAASLTSSYLGISKVTLFPGGIQTCTFLQFYVFLGNNRVFYSLPFSLVEKQQSRTKSLWMQRLKCNKISQQRLIFFLFFVVVVRENIHSSSYNTDDNRKNCFSITAFSNVICVICYISHCCTQKHKLKQRTKLQTTQFLCGLYPLCFIRIPGLFY